MITMGETALRSICDKALAASAARRSPSSSSRFVVAVARRFPITTRIVTSASRDVTFWWIAAFA